MPSGIYLTAPPLATAMPLRKPPALSSEVLGRLSSVVKNMRASFAEEMKQHCKAKDKLNPMQADNAPMTSSRKKRRVCKPIDEEQREARRKHMQKKRDMKLTLKDPDTAEARTICQKYMGHGIPD